MILFCDTSALVKLYVRAAGSEEVIALAAGASMVAVSRIAWAEMMAALARRAREVAVDSAPIDEIRRRFRIDWARYAHVEVTQPLVELAGEYADTFALRGYDSIQLASARILQEAAGQVHFSAYDTRLQKAAKVLGMA